MELRITNVLGTTENFSSVEHLRQALQGVEEDDSGDLVTTKEPLDARLNITVEGLDASTFGSIVELVEAAGGNVVLVGVGK